MNQASQCMNMHYLLPRPGAQAKLVSLPPGDASAAPSWIGIARLRPRASAPTATTPSHATASRLAVAFSCALFSLAAAGRDQQAVAQVEPAPGHGPGQG